MVKFVKLTDRLSDYMNGNEWVRFDEIMQACLDNPDALSDWEFSFVDGRMANRMRSGTQMCVFPRQRIKLEQIAKKLGL